MQFFRFLMLYVAATVLLMHHLVPHQHQPIALASEAEILFFQDCPNPADYWERAFSFNPAPEHFEAYYPSSDDIAFEQFVFDVLDFPTALFYYQLPYFPAPLQFEWRGSHRFFQQEKPILSAFVAEIPSLRAPPRA